MSKPEVANHSQAELIARGPAEPVNLEMPFSSLGERTTPNEQFYVRCHFPIPTIAAQDWRLRVEGAVGKPLELSLDELQQMPRTTVAATMECAGNGRSRLEPKVKGTPWDIGAVGNAEWTGVTLREVLQRVGVTDGAREVILEGADQGAIKEPPRPPGEIRYARSLPVAKAYEDVLLAFEMNGAPLPAAHGFPLRAVVPGWFGMASVKWLKRIVVTVEPFSGYFQSIDYTYWEAQHGLPTLVPITEMLVKAQIARPKEDEIVAPNRPYRVYGAAWGGVDQVTRVEFSADGGASWSEAQLLDAPVKHAWRFWEFDWRTPSEPGSYEIVVRATDSAGKTQPAQRVAEYGSYIVNHWLPTRIEVR